MKRFLSCSLIFCLALFFWVLESRTVTEAQQPATVVIEGGTLIDGNGGAPVPDALIIAVGNKITTVSRKGQAAYPPNAQVIKADGKFILPGLWDAETNFCGYMGEAMLNNGITSTADIGDGEEVAMLYSKAVNQEKIGGPRLFTAIGSFRAPDPGRATGLETPYAPHQTPKSFDDMKERVDRLIAGGATNVLFMDGFLPAEWTKAAFDEAHKAGISAQIRPSGPKVFPREAILAGADYINHSVGIAQAIAKDPSKWKDELDFFADMDDAKATDLIQLAVQHHVATDPLLIRKALGYQKAYPQFVAEALKLFSEPNFRFYYPDERMHNRLANFVRVEDDIRGLDPAVYERRKRGYQNALRFYRQFVQAGGHVTTGGDAPNNCTPGFCTHDELQIFAEAGFTPTQMIQSVTKWPAEVWKVQDKLGTIETGKLADIVIVNDDPMQDIGNLKHIDHVIFNGKVVELGYHLWYRPVFVGSCGEDGSPVIEGREWVTAMKRETFQGRAGAAETVEAARLSGASLPTPGVFQGGGADPDRVPPPGIEAISQTIVTQGDPTLVLTVKGFNFYRRSFVLFNNMAVPFRRVSPTEMQVTIDASLLGNPGRYPIVVKTPGPFSFPDWGDGTSNKAYLLVNFKY